MNDRPQPPHPCPGFQLTQEICTQVVQVLQASLPPPLENSPEGIARRDRVAIAQIASMLPINAEEANLAAQCVIASAFAADHLRSAAQHAADVKLAGKFRTLAARAGRESRSLRSLLMRIQAARQKGASAMAPRPDTIVGTKFSPLGLMTEALQQFPPPAAKQPAAPTLGLPHSKYETAQDVARTARLMREASRYAMLYPLRAKRIRQYKGVPPDWEFETPDPALVAAIVLGNTSSLRWADRTEDPAV
jgi:hypothetical protein